MAAEPKSTPAGRMYGRGPKIDAEREPPGGAAGGGAAAEPKEAPRQEKKDEGPKGDVMAGTDGIPTHHHEQSGERAALHHRHVAEHHDMHHRHEREHLMRVMGHHKEDGEAMHER